MLSEKQIERLHPPAGQAQIRVRDEKQRGLYLVVGKETKTWMLKRKNVWTRVGGWPQLGVAAARNRVLELLAAGDMNRPMGLTVSVAHDHWKKMRAGRSPHTIRSNKEFLSLHFEDWQNTDLHKITRLDVQRRHEKITRERGPKAANNAIKAFRAWWNAAMRVDAALPAAPVHAVNWHDQKPVDESALYGRLDEWNALVDTAVTNPLRVLMLRFALLTGLRANDVKTMRWADVTEDALYVPKPKGGKEKAFSIPLVDAHLEILEAAKPHGRRGLVFPFFNMRLSPKEMTPFKDLPWSPHSLRRCFITAATEESLTPYEIALLVNHSVPGVTFGYIARDAADMRGAMQRVVARLQSRLQPG